MNMPGLRDPVVMRVLSDFYWTAATGAGLFTSNSAQRRAGHCVQGGTCTLLRTSFVDTNFDQSDQGNIPDAVTWTCGKNMNSMKARFVLLICKLSTGVVTL